MLCETELLGCLVLLQRLPSQCRPQCSQVIGEFSHPSSPVSYFPLARQCSMSKRCRTPTRMLTDLPPLNQMLDPIERNVDSPFFFHHAYLDRLWWRWQGGQSYCAPYRHGWPEHPRSICP